MVEIYEKYLANENEKELWQKYDRICFNKIEEEKRQRSRTNELFLNNSVQKENLMEKESIGQDMQIVEDRRKSFFSRIIRKIKAFFTKK